jgi:hypothetical protein
MKSRIPLACASCLLLVATAGYAQTSQTPPKPTTTAPPTANTPRNTGGADKDTFQAGAKPDASAGCSTPTDAKSAGVDEKAKESNARTRPGEKRTVCTTAGAEGVGAKDKKADEPKKSASAPSSTSPKPR